MKIKTEFDLLVHRFFQCKGPRKFRYKGGKKNRQDKFNSIRYLQKKLGVKII